MTTQFRTYEFYSGRRLNLAVGDEVRYFSTGVITSKFGHPVIGTVVELGTELDGTVKVLPKMDTDDVVNPCVIDIARIDAVFPKFK